MNEQIIPELDIRFNHVPPYVKDIVCRHVGVTLNDKPAEILQSTLSASLAIVSSDSDCLLLDWEEVLTVILDKNGMF